MDISQTTSSHFFTLADLNLAIKGLLEDLNQRPFKKLPGSRLSQFNALDKPALKPLPATPYEYLEFKLVRVNMDYHIEFDKHYYSVPHHLVKTQVDVLIIDDWDLEPLMQVQKNDLLEIMEERHNQKSTIVTSQLPQENWHSFIDDPTLADATLD